MKRAIFAILVVIVALLPVQVFAADTSGMYEPAWKTVDFPSNITLNIDVNSVQKDATTGIISFLYEKVYDVADAPDGAIQSVAGRVDYNSATNEYWIRSLNYIRKNGPAMDVHMFYRPDWREVEKGSIEEVFCKEAETISESIVF